MGQRDGNSPAFLLLLLGGTGIFPQPLPHEDIYIKSTVLGSALTVRTGRQRGGRPVVFRRSADEYQHGLRKDVRISRGIYRQGGSAGVRPGPKGDRANVAGFRRPGRDSKGGRLDR